MKFKKATKQITGISDTDTKCLENDLLDIEDWILKAVEGKINKCKKRFIREWQQKLMADPNVGSIPAHEEDFINMVTARSDYKNRALREEERASRERERALRAEERASREEEND